MKKIIAYSALALLIGALFTGCATLFGGGPQQKVTVSSDQPKAHFLIKDKNGQVAFDGTDPGELTLSKNTTYSVEVTLDGYAKQTVTIGQGINGWFWGNLCIGGVLGFVIDWATGSMWDLQPTKLSVKLHTAMAKSDLGYVVTFLTRDDKGALRSVDLELTKI